MGIYCAPPPCAQCPILEAADVEELRCPDNGASVDTTSCETRGETGAGHLMAAWQDPDFDASQGAFYYVRAIQNPTCRWSTYDAIRLGHRAGSARTRDNSREGLVITDLDRPAELSFKGIPRRTSFPNRSTRQIQEEETQP